MSYSFDNEISPSHIFRFKASTGAFSADLKDETIFDYFDNDAAVGDILYIGLKFNAKPFHNVKFYVGTAFAATSATFVWEYSDINGVWQTISDLVDNTAGFTALGERWVTFPIPSNWFWIQSENYHNYRSSDLNEMKAKWVRCRITAITEVTEGGAQSTQVAKIKDYMVTADNEATVTMTTLHDADVANGWGVITKTGDQSYVINANLKMKSSSFKSTVETIRIGSTEYPFMNFSDSGSSFQLGNLGEDGIGKDGSILIHYTKYPENNFFYGYKIYGSLFMRFNGRGADPMINGTIYMVDSIIIFDDLLVLNAQNGGNLTRTLLDVKGWIYCYCPVNINALSLSVNCLGITVRYYLVPMSNVDFGTKTLWVHFRGRCDLVNCSIINANIITSADGADGTEEVNKKYTLDLTITDKFGNAISGAVVKLTDVDGTQTFSTTTDANGKITQQTIRVYRKWWPSPDWEMNEKDYSPFILTITKKDYHFYIKKFNLEKKEDWRIALQEIVYYQQEYQQEKVKTIKDVKISGKISIPKISGKVKQIEIGGKTDMQKIEGEVKINKISSKISGKYA